MSFKVEQSEKIYVAGHTGLVGSAIVRALKARGYNNILTRTHSELDLTNQQAVEDFFRDNKPQYVFLAAAKVGGIMANSTYPADFIYDNLVISTNIIHASFKHKVKKLCNLGSSCIYPKFASQPIKESELLTSPLEQTNEAYAIAKIAAIKLCNFYNKQYGTNFISVMPTNQYGIGDNFNMETAHLLPMVIRRFHLARLLQNDSWDEIRKDLAANPIGWHLEYSEHASNSELEKLLNTLGAYRDKVVLWGDGSVYRELMCSDDMADACLYLMENVEANEIGELVNITAGTDIQLKDLFNLVQEITGFIGRLEYDKTKPNGTPRKLMDAAKIRSLGWQPKTNLKEGIESYYRWYCNQ